MSSDPNAAQDAKALAGIRVLDLTHYVAGPYCTKLLAGFGAEVIKIERPGGGDPLRAVGPFVDDEPGLDRSVHFLYLNTGKKSVTLDLKSARGIEVFRELVKQADVLVENFAPRVLPSLGLDYAALQAINPQLVMASISNFGQTGPYRDWRADEISLYALGGAMHTTGEAGKPPLGPGVTIAQSTAGMTAYTAILMALWNRLQDNEGQHIDVSIMENVSEQVETALTDHLQRGAQPRRGPHIFTPWGTFACQDGYVAAIGAPFRYWPRCAALFEEPRLSDERFRLARDRSKHRDEIHALMQPWLDRHTRHEVFQAAMEQGLAFGYLATFDEVLQSPQHAAREFFVDVDHPSAGRQKYCDAPFKMSATPWKTDRAPRLGEHNQEILGDLLGYESGDVTALVQEGVLG